MLHKEDFRRIEKSLLFICPLLNEANTIEKLITSLQNQNYMNWHVFFGNNNSSDKTSELVKNYSKLDNRISIIDFDLRVNVGDSLRRTIQEAYSILEFDYVMIVGGDDLLVGKDFIQDIISRFQKNANVVLPQLKNELLENNKLIFNQNTSANTFSRIKLWVEPKMVHLVFSVYTKKLFKSDFENILKNEKIKDESKEFWIGFTALTRKIELQRSSSYYLKRLRRTESFGDKETHKSLQERTNYYYTQSEKTEISTSKFGRSAKDLKVMLCKRLEEVRFMPSRTQIHFYLDLPILLFYMACIFLFEKLMKIRK